MKSLTLKIGSIGFIENVLQCLVGVVSMSITFNNLDKERYYRHGDKCPMCGKGALVYHRLNIEQGLIGCSSCPWCRVDRKKESGSNKGVLRND